MNKFLKYFLIFSIVFIMLVVIPTNSRSDVVISNNYNMSFSMTSPNIIYNNTTIPYVTISINNYQSLSTSKNFQMLIKVDWLLYENYLNSVCSNVRFYNSTEAIGKTSGYGVLPAWIETNDSNTATSSNVWINLSGTIIPANGQVNIYMAFLSKSTSWNSYLGLNPLLSSTYGQNDNGQYVFLYYNNGLTLMPLSNTGKDGSGPSITSSAPSPYVHAITGKVNDGSANALTWTTNGITNISSPSFNLPSSYIAQMRVYLSGNSPLTDLLTNVQSITKGRFYVFRFDARGGNYFDGIGYYPYGASITTFLSYTQQQSSKNTWYQMTAINNNDNLYLYQATYSSKNSFILNNFGSLIANHIGVGYRGGGIAVTTDGASSTDYWTMIIVREYPPNGVMPSYSFSNILNPILWHTKLNFYKDIAYTNITSIWSSGIYCDDNGNVFWTDTYGNVFVKWTSNGEIGEIVSLGTPYSYFAYAGPITSIAAINYTTNPGNSISEVILLTYKGYVFGYNLNTNKWFNASYQWNLPLQNYPFPWTSVTSNVEGYNNGYDEGFFFTDLNGNVYFYDTTTPSNSVWIINNNPNYNIISTVAYYNSTYIKGNNPRFQNIYGISYNGYLYSLIGSGNGGKIKYQWQFYKTGINNLTGITIDYAGYLYLMRMNNGTDLYVSSNMVGSTPGSFYPIGNPIFFNGTNEAITYDQNNSKFWAIQTNGTIANDNGTGGISWYYIHNLPYLYKYPTILAINSSYSLNFDAYALYLSSKNITSMYNFSLYFTGSDGLLNLEFTYNRQNNLLTNQANPSLLANTNGILINVTMIPNKAYNTTFYFYVVFYPQNNQNSIILEYILDINVINHFPYIPI